MALEIDDIPLLASRLIWSKGHIEYPHHIFGTALEIILKYFKDSGDKDCVLTMLLVSLLYGARVAVA